MLSVTSRTLRIVRHCYAAPSADETAYVERSTVSDTANRLLKRMDSEGSPSVAEGKSSAVPLFAAVTCRQSAPDYLTRER